MLPVEQSCYWLATREGYVADPPLKGDCSADYAVVGTGFTELWSAHFLKQLSPNSEVVIQERSVSGMVPVGETQAS